MERNMEMKWNLGLYTGFKGCSPVIPFNGLAGATPIVSRVIRSAVSSY